MTHRSIAIGKNADDLPVFSGPAARWGWRVLLIATTCLSVQAVAFAQTASQITPPSFRPPQQADTAGVSIPEGSGLVAPVGAEKLRVKLADVRVEGGLPDMAEATRKIIASLAHRTVTAAEIFAAARALETEYGRAGYALVRVVLPAQKLNDGARLRLVVVDGFLERIDTSNLPERIRGRVEATLAPLVGQKSIKLSAIERKLLLAGDTPGARLRSTLQAGSVRGASVLVIDGKRAVTVTANSGQGKTYGNADPSLGYSFSDLGSGVALVGALDRASGENVGTYAIGQGTITNAANSNYDITFAAADFSIGKRAVTVTATAGQGKTYGDADPLSYGYTYSDLGSGAALVGALDRASGENVGSYAIGQGTITNANNSNYDITYVSGDFSIAKRSITVTADAQSRLQGMPNPPLTYTIGGLGLVGSDTLAGALSTDAITSSAPGSYAIEQGSLGASANYELTYVGANLVVSPSNAVPTADAASTVEYNYETHGGGRPAPVFFTGRPSSGDMQTIIEDPRLDGPVICKGTEVAAACVVASAQ